MSGVKRKGNSEANGNAKKRQAITLEVKMDIIKRLERGERMSDVARKFNMNRSTVGTILKNKEKIVEHVKFPVPMQSTIITKRRGKVIEEMEKLLSVWIEDCIQERKPLCLVMIQEKALSLFNELKADYDEKGSFIASHGWFNRFKTRTNLHNVFANDFTRFEELQEEKRVVNNLISSEKLELELEKQELTEFFDAHAKELTNDELRELENQKKEEEEEEKMKISTKHFQTKQMAQAFVLIEGALALFEELDPNKKRHSKVSAAVHDAVKCYRAIYEEKQKALSQTLLHRLFINHREDKHEALLPSTPQSVPSTSTSKPDANTGAGDPSPILSTPSSPSTSS